MRHAWMLVLLLPTAAGQVVIEDDSGDAQVLDVIQVLLEPVSTTEADITVRFSSLQAAEQGEVDVTWIAKAPYGEQEVPHGVRFRLYPDLEVYELRWRSGELDESIRQSEGERRPGTPGELRAVSIRTGNAGAILQDFEVTTYGAPASTPDLGAGLTTGLRGAGLDVGSGDGPLVMDDGIPWADEATIQTAGLRGVDSVDEEHPPVGDALGFWITPNGTGFDAQVSLRGLSPEAVGVCPTWSILARLSDRGTDQWLDLEAGIDFDSGHPKQVFGWGAEVVHWSADRDITGTTDLQAQVRLVAGEPGYVQWHVENNAYTHSLSSTPYEVRVKCTATDSFGQDWGKPSYFSLEPGSATWFSVLLFAPGVLGLLWYIGLLRKTKE